MDRTLQRQFQGMLKPPPKYARNSDSADGEAVVDGIGVVRGDGEPVVARGSGDIGVGMPTPVVPTYLPEIEQEDVSWLTTQWITIQWEYRSSATTLGFNKVIAPTSMFPCVQVDFMNMDVLTAESTCGIMTSQERDIRGFETMPFGKYLVNPMTSGDMTEYIDLVVPEHVIEQAKIPPVGYPDPQYPLSAWERYILQSTEKDDCTHTGPVAVYRGQTWALGREYSDVVETYSPVMQGRFYVMSPQPDRNEVGWPIALNMPIGEEHLWVENWTNGYAKRHYDFYVCTGRDPEKYMHLMDYFENNEEITTIESGETSVIGTYTYTERFTYYIEVDETGEIPISTYCLKMNFDSDSPIPTPNPFYVYPPDLLVNLDGELILKSQYPMECWIEYKRIDSSVIPHVATITPLAHLVNDGDSYERTYNFEMRYSTTGSYSYVYSSYSSPEPTIEAEYYGFPRTYLQQDKGLFIGIQMNTSESSPTGNRYTPYKMIPIRYVTQSQVVLGDYLSEYEQVWEDYKSDRDIIFRKSDLDIILSNHPYLERPTSGAFKYSTTISRYGEKLSFFASYKAWDMTMDPDLTEIESTLALLGLSSEDDLYDARYEHISEEDKLIEDDFVMSADTEGNIVGNVYTLFPPTPHVYYAGLGYRNYTTQIRIQASPDQTLSWYTLGFESTDTSIRIAAAPGNVENAFDEPSANIVALSIPSDCIIEHEITYTRLVLSSPRGLNFTIRPY